MTASDIANIVVTVVMIQMGCDVWFRWRVYHTESYQRSLQTLERANQKFHREQILMEKEQINATTTTTTGSTTTSTSKQAQKNNDRWKKRWQRAQEDHAEAVALVSQKHIVPNVWTSIVFVVLMRILGTEYSGKLIGVLPFTVPFPWIQRWVTSRGLEFIVTEEEEITVATTTTTQACSFFLIYFLCGMSVKFYASKLFGTSPPKEAEGFMAIMNSPQGRKVMRSMGVDPDEFSKMD